MVAGVNEHLQAIGSPVAGLGSIETNAVVSPVPATREFSDRHQFNGGDAELLQVGQLGNDGLKGAFRRKRARVQFINYEIFECHPFPARVRPGKCRGIDDTGGSVYARRLPAGDRIRQPCSLGSSKHVIDACAHSWYERGKFFAVSRHWETAGLGPLKLDADRLKARRPDTKRNTIWLDLSAKPESPGLRSYGSQWTFSLTNRASGSCSNTRPNGKTNLPSLSSGFTEAWVNRSRYSRFRHSGRNGRKVSLQAASPVGRAGPTPSPRKNRPVTTITCRRPSTREKLMT